MKTRSLILPVALAMIALAWRVAKLKLGMVDALPGFAPWLALAFAGAAVMPKQAPWYLWPALLLGVDLACHPQDVAEMWLVYACLGAAALWGSSARDKASVTGIIGGTVVCSVAFYLVTSTQAWFVSPAYAKSVAGWLQALTVGDPNYQPQAWTFFVRSLLSDTLFSAVLVLAYNSEAKAREMLPMPVGA